jgi:hypothetical protein
LEERYLMTEEQAQQIIEILIKLELTLRIIPVSIFLIGGSALIGWALNGKR